MSSPVTFIDLCHLYYQIGQDSWDDEDIKEMIGLHDLTSSNGFYELNLQNDYAKLILF